MPFGPIRPSLFYSIFTKERKNTKKDVGTLNVCTYICSVKSIGEEIQQSEFSDAYQKLGINILFTAAWFGERNRLALKYYDISWPRVCDKDRRQVDVVITDKGISLLEELNEKMPSFKTIMAKQLSSKDAEALNFALDQIRNQK